MSADLVMSPAPSPQPRDRLSRVRIFLEGHFELRQSSAGYVPSMEGMRGFAMLLVFLAHYHILSQPWLAESSWTNRVGGFVGALGTPAVSLFFLISGFGIYGSLIRKPFSIARFIVRRLQRLYPPFLAVFVCYLALSFSFPAESKLPDNSMSAALYVLQNLALLPGLFDIRPIISQAWTLSYELFFYISVPLLISALGLQAWARGQRVGLFVGVGVLFVTYCALFGGPVELAMFLTGMILYDTISRSGGRLLGMIGIVALILGFGIAYVIEPRHVLSVPRTIVVSVAFYVVCFASFSNSGMTSWLFSLAPLRWLGNMSYSFYLLHGLVLNGIFLAVDLAVSPTAAGQGVTVFWLLLPLSLVLTITASAILYLTVEEPLSVKRLSFPDVLRPLIAFLPTRIRVEAAGRDTQ